MKIERDNGLSDLGLTRSEEAQRLCAGFGFTEGPVWVPADDCLLFTDIPNNRIHRWRPGMTTAEVWREPSRHANGLTLDHDGHVLACEHAGRQVTRAPYAQPDSTLPVAAQLGNLALNSPNDIVVHSSGAIYFTDPDYGLPKDLTGKELGFQGVYRIDTDGGLTLLIDDFSQPNGLAFSPDESFLYIGDSKENILKRYRVQPDGSLTGGEVFIDASDDRGRGVFDGMKVDDGGRLWTTGPGGVWVVEPDGTVLGVAVFPEQPANIAFGGPGTHYSTIYVTARTSVYSAETTVRGIRD